MHLLMHPSIHPSHSFLPASINKCEVHTWWILFIFIWRLCIQHVSSTHFKSHYYTIHSIQYVAVEIHFWSYGLYKLENPEKVEWWVSATLPFSQGINVFLTLCAIWISKFMKENSVWLERSQICLVNSGYNTSVCTDVPYSTPHPNDSLN